MNSAAVVTLLLAYSNYVDATHAYPRQHFHLISNLPEIGRKQDDVYVYAIYTDMTVSEGDSIEFSKEGGLPRSTVQTGMIAAGDPVFGCYLKPDPPSRLPGVRFGRYTATFTPETGQPSAAYTFIKPKTSILDTSGVYTVTIYPDAEGSKTLAEKKTIGVRWSPDCRKITWCKGNRRDVNRGQKLVLDSIDDAGLYTISRSGRGANGWFVHILVIAATCPEDQYWDGDSCEPRVAVCLNGGVGRDEEDECVCPPFLAGTACAGVVAEQVNYAAYFVLAIHQDNEALYLECKDLPGGNANCRGFLFCFGDLYGCSCGLGWKGNNCETPCSKGRYGVNCSMKCPDSDNACDRFFGVRPAGGI